MALRWEKLAGTLASWFGLGGEEEVGIGINESGHMIFKDEHVFGTPTLTEVMEGGTDPGNYLVSRNTGQLMTSRNDGEVLVHR